jgi:hypothetical protein
MAHKTALKAYQYKEGKEHKGKLYPYFADVNNESDVHNAGEQMQYKYDYDRDMSLGKKGNRGGFSVTSVDRTGEPDEYDNEDLNTLGLQRREKFKRAVLEHLMYIKSNPLSNWPDRNKLYEVQLDGDITPGAKLHKPWDEDIEDYYDDPFVDNNEEHIAERMRPHREIKLKLEHPATDALHEATNAIYQPFKQDATMDNLGKVLRDRDVVRKLRAVGLKPKAIRMMRVDLAAANVWKDEHVIQPLIKPKNYIERFNAIHQLIEAAYAYQTTEDAVEEHARSRNAISDEALKVFTRKYQ